MFRTLVALAWLALYSGMATAASSELSITVMDARTGDPVADARIIATNGPPASPVSTEMVQKNRQFQPHTLLVAKGSEVNFPNKDATQHHVYSFSPAKSFNLELFADQPEAPIVFDKTGIVEVGCNIHDQMQGFIVVTDSDLTAQTDDTGNASLSLPETLATGDLKLQLWHPRLTDVTQMVELTLNLPSDNPVELTLELSPEPPKTGRLDSLQNRYRDL
ncbi:methylamine utilization protein [Marinobacter sp. CHS3-4]|uniref:methylamine utilization protein n=1 Tax=Marinobacter sp. CHS3-4 TaxID=3045174 RepID=UPI0024B6135E|nr:methylamine utilization protein [Marinobacter sp. CHS3-4]MDI9243749.1 methylamine utilization protein [Marinobacter sp. CHS3-4]